jgi:hypothetical protein
METLAGDITYANQTTVNPVGFFILLVLGLFMLGLPRHWAVLPLLVMACFVSSAQRIVVAGFDLDFSRILVLFGAFRIAIKNEYVAFQWRPLDTAVLLWGMSSALFYTLRLASLSAFVNRLGFCFDAIGMYLLFRCLIRNWQDVARMVKGLLWISIPLAFLFLIENRTGHNMFSVFGGVPAVTAVREGRLRCQGAYSHAILAGCFWASIMPLFAARWWESGKDKMWAVGGTLAALVIVVCCASSTPVLAVLCAVMGGMMFYWRRYMRSLRWIALYILIALHIVMSSPVWHLISRVSAVGGSTGWHRANLIDQTIRQFSDWYVMGCSVSTVASWGVWAGDVTNQYILEGINGGFVTMCLFIYCVAVAYREVGKLWRGQPHHSYELRLAWTLGVCLFVHCMCFTAVSYFGQIMILWYMLLAMIGSLSTPNKALRIRRHLLTSG